MTDWEEMDREMDWIFDQWIWQQIQVRQPRLRRLIKRRTIEFVPFPFEPPTTKPAD